MDWPFLLGGRKGIPQTREEKNDQVDCCRWLCLSRRNFGASNNASANSSTGRHGDAVWVEPELLVSAWQEPPSARPAGPTAGVTERNRPSVQQSQIGRQFASANHGFHFQSSSAASNLNPNRARPPATMRAIQLSEFGTDQSPMMTGQSSNIRIRWNRATKVKIAPATVENVLRFMGATEPTSGTVRPTVQPCLCRSRSGLYRLRTGDHYAKRKSITDDRRSTHGPARAS